MKIKQLSPHVANQIAAGEVIERPASVVKELLENAVDAGASQVQIDIAFGGLNQIKISDNGMGISAEDLPLAIAPHATSKISVLDDLYSIASMGFRGEALASIASVSKMSIRSKTTAQEHAMMLQSIGDECTLLPCARNQGTTIDVQDLFYNVPVRKKFLKTERLEFLAIESVVRRFAMGAPHIALNLTHNGKQVLDLPSARGEMLQYKRLVKLFGQGFAKTAVYLDVERSGMRLYGWLSGADYQRSQNDRQWVYINQRMVKDKLIHHAIKQVFEGVLHPGRFPSCLLYLNLPVNEVDVNVHPTKNEVRFQQPRLVHDFMTSQLAQAMMINKETQQHEGGASCEPDITSVQATEVFEPYPKPLLEHTPSKTLRSQATWFTLNQRYAMVFYAGKSSIIDAKALQEHYLKQLVNTYPPPFDSRPLLVPLRYPLPPASLKNLKIHVAEFNDLGLVYTFEGEEHLLLQRVPVILPHLDIGLFLDKLKSMVGINVKSILSELLTCQTFDLYNLSPEEKDQFIHYLSTLDDTQSRQLNIAKFLSEEACQVFFND